jgi:hypothetical protein
MQRRCCGRLYPAQLQPRRPASVGLKRRADIAVVDEFVEMVLLYKTKGWIFLADFPRFRSQAESRIGIQVYNNRSSLYKRHDRVSLFTKKYAKAPGKKQKASRISLFLRSFKGIWVTVTSG